MSNLRDIMDVDDIEPLEAQAHRRSRASAQQQEQSSTHIYPLHRPLQSEIAPEPPLKRRKSDPVPPIAPVPTLASRQSFAPPQPMAGYMYEQTLAEQVGSSSSGGRRSSRASDLTDSPVRLTPVTRRISRAKKGHPVHICQICDPPKTFTRAEHLRRHQLGHDKPKYPCTFEGCEKAFHRRDLLTRHMLRHDSGEKLEPDSRTRSGSSSSESDESPRVGASSSAEPSSKPLTESSHEPSTNLSGYAGTAPPEGSSRKGHASHQAGRASETSFPATSVNRHHHEEFPEFNSNQGPIESLYSNPTDGILGSSDDVMGLGLHMPNTVSPELSHINSSFLTSNGTWLGTPSEIFDRATPEWDCQPSTWPHGHYSRSNLRSLAADLGQYELTSYPSPPFLSPVPTSFPTAVLSSPISGFQMAPVDPLPFTRVRKGVAQTAQVLSPPPNMHEFPGSCPEPGVWMASSKTNFSPHRKVHPAPTEEQLYSYLDSFFEHTEPKFPIMHAGIIDQSNEMLRNAMAALGSQYGTKPEDRREGARLHDSCRRMIAQVQDFTVQTMQAIVLTELFARYRARRVDISLSNHFKLCYDHLLQAGPEDSACMFADLKAVLIDSEIERRLEIQMLNGPFADRQQLLHAIWCEWIEYETRQRLRSACFIIDVHQQRFFEQHRCHPDIDYDSAHLVLPCSDILWNAADSVQWYSKICLADYSSLKLSSAEELPPSEISERSRADKFLILCSLTSHLPTTAATAAERTPPDAFETKIIYLFPYWTIGHAYLALNYTPLQHLLALTGSTYVFGRKITSHEEVDQIEPNIRKWSSSPAAAQAAWHACQVLYSAFAKHGVTSNGGLCQYWAVYTSALICWAFGHRAGKRRGRRSWGATTTTTASSLGGRLKADSSFTSDNSEESLEGRIESGVPLWIQTMLGLGPDAMVNCPDRGDTTALLYAAKVVLDDEALGGKSMCGLMLDACRVLNKLIEGDITF